jgi:hypothetical protein
MFHSPRVKCFTAPGSRSADDGLRKEIEMTSIELWLVNVVGLTFLCSFMFYLFQLATSY